MTENTMTEISNVQENHFRIQITWDFNFTILTGQQRTPYQGFENQVLCIGHKSYAL